MKSTLKALHQRPIAYYPIYHRITGSIGAGLLLSFLSQEWVLYGEKYFSNQDLMKKLNFSTKTLDRCMKKIKPFVSIKKMSDIDVFTSLNKKNSTSGCLFCGYDKTYLDQHHYPVRRRDGGVETIQLCANCHREFHFLSDYKKAFVPNPEIITDDFIEFVKEVENEFYVA